MSSGLSDDKRIAKNTFLLYVRMFFLIIVNLYMSRVVLNALGFEDFGLYSVVGSVVSFLGFLNTAMAAAAQRFMSYASGIGEEENLNSTFNSIMVVQFIIAGIIFVLGETAGVFYIENYLNVIPDKIPEAHIVYQLSLFAFFVSVITVPYNASIIANERMDVFALFSILDVLLKLSVSFLITLFPDNRLIIYSVLLSISISLIQGFYYLYCRVKFPECQIRRNAKKITIHEILTYSGWNLLGSFSHVAIDQGVNIILNSFFGVVVNAARGIAFQVSSAVAHLAGNFMQAMNPQIVKSYAKEDFPRMHTLVIQGTRLSYFLLFICAMPLIVNMGGVLRMWLGNVPDYTEFFCVLVVINSLMSSIAQPLLMGVMATGKIKKYQLVVASINMLNFPFSIIALYIIPNPYVTVYIMIALTVVSTLARLIITRGLIGLSIKQYFHKAIRPIVVTTFFSVIISLFIDKYISFPIEYADLFLKVIIVFISTLVCVSMLGASAQERRMVYNYVKRRIKR